MDRCNDKSSDQQLNADQKVREKKKMVEILKSTTMTTTEKKQRLNQLLNSHDWHYQRTEDSRVYRRGSEQRAEIMTLVSELKTEGDYLFTKFHRREFPDLY